MKHIIAALLIAICFSSPIFAQNVGDIIYYDANWKKINSRGDALYYRTIDRKDGNVTYVTDHYINSKPQMTGGYSSFEPEVREGEFVFYNDQGQMISKTSYKANKLNGNGQFFSDGKLQSEVYYVDDKYDGKYKSFFPNGQLRTDQDYTNGQLNGLFLSYYPDGKKKRIEHYKDDNMVDGKCFTRSGADTTYFPYMVVPQFGNSEDDLARYIGKNLKYPKEAKKNNITGKVYISFNVDATGNLTDVRVAKSAAPVLDEAALAVIKTMPKWKPGIVDGQIESIEFSLPINFSLGDK